MHKTLIAFKMTFYEILITSGEKINKTKTETSINNKDKLFKSILNSSSVSHVSTHIKTSNEKCNNGESSNDLFASSGKVIRYALESLNVTNLKRSPALFRRHNEKKSEIKPKTWRQSVIKWQENASKYRHYSQSLR